MFWCDGAESKARPGSGQVKRARAGLRAGAALPLAAALAVSAPGCSSVERLSGSRLSLDTPVEWWHGLQGGRIAEQRPPPPGVTDPYPNLARVPPRPVLTDAATRRAIAAQLAGERDRARRDAANDPLSVPEAPPPPVVSPAPASRAPASRATAAPVQASPPPAPPPDPDASVVVLDAASAPPAPPPAPASPALPPPASPAPAAPAAAVAPPRPAPGRETAGAPPDLPDAPPPAPRLPGVPLTPAREPPRARPGVVVAFPRGSAEVPAAAQAALRALAAERGATAVAVQGAGDARAGGPDAQAAALPLALRRAQAVASVLADAGVPPGALRVGAQATGRGTVARLVD